MRETVEVAIAGLVHDWGKLFQRAEQPLSDQAERMAEMICPSYQGRLSHRHVLWTNDVLHKFARIGTELDWQRVTDLASRHHRPADPEDFLVSEGDRLASGHDRRGTQMGRAFKSVPLQRALAHLSLGNNGQHVAACLRPASLHQSDTIMPSSNFGAESLVPQYRGVAGGLWDALKSLPGLPVASACDVLMHLSEQFCTLTPASTIDDVPDVSLHDHSRLVAAFASALYAYHREAGTLSEQAICDRRAVKYLFVSGDLSGIQRHLFRLPTDSRKGLARCYRARSFFLAMLTHVATLRLLRATQMPVTNRVLDAGGRFVLLLPNTATCRERLRCESAKIDAWMLNTYGGDLTLNIDDSVTASGEDFLENRFAALYRRLQRQVDATKRRRFRQALVNNDQWSTPSAKLPYVVTTDWLENLADQDRQLGSALPRARSVAIFEDTAPVGLLRQPREVLGWSLQLFSAASRESGAAVDWFAISPRTGADAVTPVRAIANHVPVWNQRDLSVVRRAPDPADETSADDDEPRDVGRLITFHDLAELNEGTDEKDQSGLAAIACLKADVDRLGMLLSHGCGDRVSFGRTASISRDLDLFFRAFLPSRMEDERSPYRLVYTVFAGGDDLMLVGPWTVMLHFARDLRRWFAEFMGGSTSVTLSAGFALGAGMTPISALADAAGRAVESAKESGRNRIALFGDVLTWPQYEQALEWGEQFDALTKDKAFPVTTSFLYRLLQYARMAQRVARLRSPEEPDPQPAGGRPIGIDDIGQELLWRSHMAYDLQRNIADRLRRNDSDTARDRVQWLQHTLINDLQPQHASVLKLAATYALYRNRGG